MVDNDQPADEAQTRATMLRELDHRAKNILQLISSVLTIEKSMTRSEEARLAIGKASQRLQMLAELHSVLYLTRESSDAVQMQPYLKELSEAVLRGMKLPADRVKLEIMADDLSWPVDKASDIGMIVAETLTNACKHALCPQKEAVIRIALRRVPDGSYRLEISDDGKGFDSDAVIPGVGTTLVRALARDLKATCAVESRPGDGTHVHLTFPP